MLRKNAKIGDASVVEDIRLPFEIKRSVEARGMTRGTAVSVINRKGKGIHIIKLRGTRVALGFNITKNIEVKAGDTHGE